MKKKLFRVFILVVFFTMIWISNAFAIGVVDKEYEGDTNYGVKCKLHSGLSSNSQDDLDYTVENSGHNSKITISAKSGKNIYVTNSIELEFVWLDDASSSWFLADQTAFLYYKAPEFKVTSGGAKIEPPTGARQSTHNRDGMNHTRVKLKFTLEQVGDCIAKGTIESGVDKYPITIEIKNIQSVGMLCREELVNKYHWREVLTTGSTEDIMARNQIKALQVVPDQINNANAITFNESDRFKDRNYNQFKLGIGNIVNFRPDGRKTSTSVCDVTNGTTDLNNVNDENVTKKEYSWRELNLTANAEYVFKYCFAYFKDLPANKKMVYVCFGRRVEAQDGETDEEALQRTMEEMDDVGTDYVEDVMTSINFGISVSMGALGREREPVGRMVDALADRDFYTNVDNLGDDDAEMVEEKTGKIVEVITSIGIILAIIIPAILGVKYLIGSAEEKAEYKKDMIPYLVGAVLLFGVCTVVKIIQTIGTAINQI